jgi:hypothetical protein
MSASRPPRRRLAAAAALAALLAGQAAQAQAPRVDPANPTCPPSPNWSSYREMRFTVQQRPGRSPVLLAEGFIDDNMLPRLEAALAGFRGDEIWLRSPGGNAQVGNRAGRLIRANSMTTRIPEGWACFSACNFLFMGGAVRYVDRGGHFIVHMFTYTGDRDAIRNEVARGDDNTVGLIRGVEQDSVALASEDNDFLIRMGISRLLLTEVMYRVPANHYRCLTQDEVNRYNVATVPWTGR